MIRVDQIGVRVFGPNMTPAVRTDLPKPATRARLCGVAAGPLFVTVFLVEGTRRADYKPLRHPVSSLALGPRGWLQVMNFAVAGTLYLAAARGLSRTPDPLLGSRLGPTLFAATGVGLLGSAAFSTDPFSGYPPGTANLPTVQTTRMKAHGIAAIPIFLGIPAAAFVYARRFHRSAQPTWALYSAATGVTIPATMGLAGAGFNQAPTLVDIAGLLQRTAIVTGLGWLTALSARSLRPSARRSKGWAGRCKRAQSRLSRRTRARLSPPRMPA